MSTTELIGILAFIGVAITAILTLFYSSLFERKSRERVETLEIQANERIQLADTAMKRQAIEALKSNVELKLNLADIKSILSSDK